MSSYKRFEDLPAWQAAIDLGLRVFSLTNDPIFRSQGDLRSQIRRAALSVSNNIAEGFERGTTNELLAFLYIARGSAGEVRSMMRVLERWKLFGHCRSQISNFIAQCERISKQTYGCIHRLKDSDLA